MTPWTFTGPSYASPSLDLTPSGRIVLEDFRPLTHSLVCRPGKRQPVEQSQSDARNSEVARVPDKGG